MIAMGYDPFNVRLSSDHRGFFLDFDTDKLFGNPTSDLASVKRRMLKANNTAQVTTYINKMYELLLAHNAFDPGTRLTYPGNRHQFAERLDGDVLAASLAAETAILNSANTHGLSNYRMHGVEYNNFGSVYQ